MACRIPDEIFSLTMLKFSGVEVADLVQFIVCNLHVLSILTPHRLSPNRSPCFSALVTRAMKLQCSLLCMHD